VDREAVQKFTERFMQMTTGAMTLGLVGVGDRTGLFASLAGQGPLTLAEIVERTGLQERYLREMLAGLAAAEILRYEPSAQTFELPEAHAVCLADESSPYFMCGWTQMVPSVLNAVPGVARACREGGGVPFSEFGEDMVAGIDRSNSPGLRILLTRRWLTSMPDVVKRLEAGIRVADIGCGSGSAVLTMAKAYPASEVTGYDIDPRSVERARAHAEAAGLPNAQFEQCGADEIPATQPFDLITTFDVIHDIAKPRDALRHIRGALASDGTYLMVEPAAGDTLEENLHPGGAMLYAISTLHCMTQSLAHGGEGLGAAWGPRQAEELCREAGFTQFRRLDVDNPFNAFYEVRP
jgi:2-polyprenyl-3-methyl-5-hydroxy-6-metoxy-1,4-benzoquinol methylase